ncbi:MAG: T9SS type A sorting domain-containing protein, partial [Ignavibacteriaceae bacterium]|nr:T9SS type A sorting domain-containing protein [Ignavibacteriaceae bacterium]
DYYPLIWSIGILVGTEGTIIRYYSRNKSLTEENISWEEPFDFRSVFFVDQKFGWIVGENGAVLGTSDGGHFALRTNLPVAYLNSVHFVSRETGMTVGTNGKIFKSTNYGLNWREVPSGVTFPLNGIFMVNADKVFIVGMNGLLLKSETGGDIPSQVEKKHVSEYKNSISVFPNPVTRSQAAGKLSFLEIELREQTSYSVAIYNSLGRQAAEIESGEKPAGKYLIPFEPENYDLSSGAYFAVLRTDSGNSTVKMLYLK